MNFKSSLRIDYSFEQCLFHLCSITSIVDYYYFRDTQRHTQKYFILAGHQACTDPQAMGILPAGQAETKCEPTLTKVLEILGFLNQGHLS